MLNLANLLPPDHIVRLQNIEDADALMMALCAPMLKSGMITDQKQFVEDLRRREAQCSTVVDEGLVAFPHARSNAARRLALSVGLMDEPGFILHPDGKTASQVFFCIAVPAFSPAAHMHLLQHLATFSRDRKRLEKLLAARTIPAAARCLHTFHV